MRIHCMLIGSLRGTHLILCMIGGLFITPTVHAASFDCAKAGTKVEHMICDNPELSKLDEELAASYKAAQKDKLKIEVVKQEQKRWMKERNACTDEDCVQRVYKGRLQNFSLPTRNLSSVSGQESRFFVTKGKGYTVCEDYARFLNSLPENEPLPLCHLKLNPASPDLREPDWDEMDIQSHLGLVYEIEKLLSSCAHDRPVDTFEHWKEVYEQQIRAGDISPRLRRTHLALLKNTPVESILAYEPDRSACDKDVEKKGYAYRGARTRLFIWDEQGQKIEPYMSHIAFGIAYDLLLYRGKPLLFFPFWGGGTYPHLTGGIDVYRFISAGIGRSYGSVRSCAIGFELAPDIIEKMSQ